MSKIEWTDETWNPTTGCTKVSPGCDNCYAESIYNRFHGPGAFDKVILHPDRLDKPLRWRKPRRVFVNSMSDLFHDAVPDAFIARIFAVMAFAPMHTFQVLTKRHGRMRALLSSPDFWMVVGDEMGRLCGARCAPLGSRALPNVWLGVSVENQQWADIRIPALVDTPAAVRFLSCEPLLGPVDLTDAFTVPVYHGSVVISRASRRAMADPYIGWVIVGAESGHGARPMDEQWARDIKDQCVAAGVPFFLKQYAVKGRKVQLPLLDGQRWTQMPEALVVS